MITMSFSHVGLVCRDPLVTERYYAKHFGFRRVRVYAPGPDQVVLIKAPDGVALELFKATEGAPCPPPKEAGPNWPCLRHLCFSVSSVDEKLREMGSEGRVTLGPLDMSAFIPGMRVCWVADPDGNIVELNQGYVDDPNPPPLAP
ncbi:MAG: VOC family protein [Candidatus Riflebacteria bacterium]|nr:VOC family protein [Candidatus Riflebacteria bacterium]